jgi:hypothetical protein
MKVGNISKTIRIEFHLPLTEMEGRRRFFGSEDRADRFNCDYFGNRLIKVFFNMRTSDSTEMAWAIGIHLTLGVQIFGTQTNLKKSMETQSLASKSDRSESQFQCDK